MNLAQFSALQMAIVGAAAIVASDIYNIPHIWLYGFFLMLCALILAVIDEMTREEE